jgi:hypothetical protein
MPRTDLENLEKRRWASKYWRELPAAKELRDLIKHELLKPIECRGYERELEVADPEQLARSVTALRSLLIIREREKKRFETTYPLTARLRAAA